MAPTSRPTCDPPWPPRRHGQLLSGADPKGLRLRGKKPTGSVAMSGRLHPGHRASTGRHHLRFLFLLLHRLPAGAYFCLGRSIPGLNRQGCFHQSAGQGVADFRPRIIGRDEFCPPFRATILPYNSRQKSSANFSIRSLIFSALLSHLSSFSILGLLEYGYSQNHPPMFNLFNQIGKVRYAPLILLKPELPKSKTYGRLIFS